MGRGWGDVLTHVFVVLKPVGFVFRVAVLHVVFRVTGLYVVFGLVHELPVLVSLVSLVFEPFGLVSCFLMLSFVLPFSVLVSSVFIAFELPELVSSDFSSVFVLVSLWCVLVVLVVVRFGVGWVRVIVDGFGMIVVRIRLLIVAVVVGAVAGVFWAVVTIRHVGCGVRN